MRAVFIPAIGESFVADLYCDTCKDYKPHIIMLEGIDLQHNIGIVCFETSCSGCSCELEDVGNGQFEVKELLKKWNDNMSIAKWRSMILDLNSNTS